MKQIDVGHTAQMLANVAVLAGIVFLAIEINQNQKVIEEQSALNLLSARDAALEGFNSMRSQLLENPDLLRVSEAARAGEELTPFEMRQYQLLCQNRIWMQVTLYARTRALGISEQMETIANTARGDNSRSRYSEDCWAEARETIEAQGYADFVKMVESVDGE